MFVEGEHGNYRTTPLYDQVRAQLLAIPNLKLIVIDPLSMWLQIDLGVDGRGASFALNLFARLARETGAAVIVVHHLRKEMREIKDIEAAREAIKGSTHVVSVPRLAYAVWSAPAEEG